MTSRNPTGILVVRQRPARESPHQRNSPIGIYNQILSGIAYKNSAEEARRNNTVAAETDAGRAAVRTVGASGLAEGEDEER
jgi:hypothetical protein